MFSRNTFLAYANMTRGRPEAMREIGIDLGGHRSKALDTYAGVRFDSVITVCDRANESCPLFPGETERIHWSFEDPSAASGTDAETLRVFRRVHDATQERLLRFVAVANPT